LRTNLEKLCNIWKTIYAKSYIRFQLPYAVFTKSCFSKFQREIWKQEDFRFCQKKMRKLICFEFVLLFLLLFNYLEVFIFLEFFNFLSFLCVFWICLKLLSFKINNLIMHKDYLEFIDACYYSLWSEIRVDDLVQTLYLVSTKSPILIPDLREYYLIIVAYF
jgi:hypothetical protein